MKYIIISLIGNNWNRKDTMMRASAREFMKLTYKNDGYVTTPQPQIVIDRVSICDLIRNANANLLTDLINDLTKLCEQFGSTSRIRIETAEYDEDLEFYVEYERNETEKEMKARITYVTQQKELDAAKKSLQIETEKKQLEKLLKKHRKFAEDLISR